jgi:hypothetical protein
MDLNVETIILFVIVVIQGINSYIHHKRIEKLEKHLKEE